MIKAIIFDVGGVCLEDNPMVFLGKLEEKAGMSKKELYFLTWDTKEWRLLYQKGLLTEKQLLEVLKKKGMVKEDVLIYIMKNGRKEILRPMPEVLKFIEKLKKRYKVYALSNVDRESVEYVKKKISIYNVFDDAVLSCEIGMAKPEQEIYKYVLKRFVLKPEECIFIDNRPKNVEGARKVGIKSILFESIEQIKRDLAKLGVNV